MQTVRVQTVFGGYVYLTAKSIKRAKSGKWITVRTARKDGTPTNSFYHVGNLLIGMPTARGFSDPNDKPVDIVETISWDDLIKENDA